MAHNKLWKIQKEMGIPDHQGEIQVILQNEAKDDLFINKYDQITQLLILSCAINKIQK